MFGWLPHQTISRVLVPDLSNEPISLARNRANKSLFLATVPDGLPQRVDAAGYRRLGDGPPTPNRFDQVVLADYAVSVLDEVDQKIEDLWSGRDQSRPALEFSPLKV